MLITPEFSLTQTETHLQITIRAPFAKIQETEISAHDNEFYFFSAPYHLHLNLPGAVVDTEQVSSSDGVGDKSSTVVKYDVDRQMFDVSLEKFVPGQYFEGLGLITSLLASSPLLPPPAASSSLSSSSANIKNTAQRDVLLPQSQVDSCFNNNNGGRLCNIIGQQRRHLIEEIESSGVMQPATSSSDNSSGGGGSNSTKDDEDKSSCKIATQQESMSPYLSSLTASAAATAVIIPRNFDWTLDHHAADYDYEEEEGGDEDARGEANSGISIKLLPSVDALAEDEPSYSYGFGNRFRDDEGGRFAKMQEAFPDVVDFRVPVGDLSLKQRMRQKNSSERRDFSEDHYMANVFDEEDQQAIDVILTEKMPWNLPGYTELSSEDRHDLVEKLKNRNYLLNQDEYVSAFLGLVDILYAYAYDMRVTAGEHCAESAWNIAKISSLLSWFVEFKSLRAVCRSCFRRSLTYPLYRNFQLSAKCWRDVVELLRLGREGVLKALLDVRRVFSVFDSSTSPRYILNDLYISDYCVWIQKVSAADLASLALAADRLELLKSELGFDVELLEDVGLMALCDDGDCNYDDDESFEKLKRTIQLGRQQRNKPLPSVSSSVNLEIENSFEKLCLDA